MITDLHTVPTAKLEYFLSAIALGLQTFSLSDGGEIIVFKKAFDPSTGVEGAEELVAAVPRVNLDETIADCKQRVAMIEAFIVANAL